MQIALKKTQETNDAIREFMAKNALESSEYINIPGPFITQIQMYESSRQRNDSALPMNKIATAGQNTKTTMAACTTHDTLEDFRVKEFTMSLFSRGHDKEVVETEILKFFKNFDASKDPHMLKLQRRIDNLKRSNTRTN